MGNLANFAAFQVVWFAVVLGAAAGVHLPGIAAVLLFLAVFLWRSPRRAADACVIGLVTVAGFTVDQAAVLAGAQVFDQETARLGLVPLWIAGLWAAFAATLDRSLAWLQRRLPLAAVLGAVFGPLAYLGAEGLGALRIGGPERAVSLLVLAAEWAAMMPLSLWLARVHAAPRPSQPRLNATD